MDRETLVAAVDAFEILYKTEAEKLWTIVKAKLNETLVEAGVDKIAKLKYEYGDSAEIEVEIPGKTYGHSMALYFNDRYYDGKKNEKRKVNLNVATFGSFDCTMQPEANYYIVAGALAKNLSSLQEKFDTIDFMPYCKARQAFYKAQYELEAFDRAAHEAELTKKANDIEAKLVPGTKLQTGTSWKNEPIYVEIERATSKFIFLKNDIIERRTKKAAVVDNILKEKWKIVA